MKYPLFALLGALTLTTGAIAQTPLPPPPAVDGLIEQLKPGEYFWTPEVSRLPGP